MENNIQGLYCSLIHQFIDENEKIITLILDYFPFAKKKTYVNDWSTPELDSVLNFILDSTEDRRPVCIFIDGLDEYQGKGGQKELSQRIRKFARIENGIDNEDSDELLITRLQDIPSDIEDLYTDIWMRLNQDLNVYRESAALFFQFLIRFQELKNMGRLTSRDSSIELHLVSLFDIACWKDTSFQQRLLSMAHETSSDEIVRNGRSADSQLRKVVGGGNPHPVNEERIL
ncbi:unnamed protein product, partial [Clonostachys rosea f. rosea IK726]